MVKNLILRDFSSRTTMDISGIGMRNAALDSNGQFINLLSKDQAESTGKVILQQGV